MRVSVNYSKLRESCTYMFLLETGSTVGELHLCSRIAVWFLLSQCLREDVAPWKRNPTAESVWNARKALDPFPFCQDCTARVATKKTSGYRWAQGSYGE